MDILLLSGTCSSSKYNQIFSERTRKFIDPSQKFFLLLAKGIVENDDVNLTCISALPVSGKCHKKKIWKKEHEKSNKINFLYPGFINISVFRLITGYFTLYKNTLKFCKDHRNPVIVYDPTDLRYSIIARKIRKKKNVKVVSLITDIPSLATVIGHRKQNNLKAWIQNKYDDWADSMLNDADGYILLTEQMNHIVNKNNKPYIVIEGSVDSTVSYCNDVKKDEPKSIVYAGGIHEKFGLINLVNAFIKADISGWELKIFGAGEAVSEIKEISKEHPAIKYMGVVPVEEIVEYEKKASLLVNPRPTNEEFTKYSFPSKTLEYMVSGTPLLTTKLPGIPDEYFDYVYAFENATVDEMAKMLNDITRKSVDDLNNKGYLAKKFVMENKNNMIQGNKIIHFVGGFDK